MRRWFSDIRKVGNWNEKELKNLISLTNYQRAKGISKRLSLKQIIKSSFNL